MEVYFDRRGYRVADVVIGGLKGKLERVEERGRGGEETDMEKVNKVPRAAIVKPEISAKKNLN